MLVLLSLATLGFGCKPSGETVIEKFEEGKFELEAKVVGRAGIPFENSAYIGCPLAHAKITSINGKEVDVLVLSNGEAEGTIGIDLLGSFTLEKDTTQRKIFLAYPVEQSLLPFPKLDYVDFMTQFHSAKLIIDQYFSNYLGLGVTRVKDWQDTPISKKLLQDFINEKTISVSE